VFLDIVLLTVVIMVMLSRRQN